MERNDRREKESAIEIIINYNKKMKAILEEMKGGIDRIKENCEEEGDSEVGKLIKIKEESYYKMLLEIEIESAIIEKINKRRKEEENENI